MSTVKSSSENLTLNADGVGSDVVIQNNGTETVRIDSSGTVTATAFSGDLNLNSNDITGTGNVDITGTVTSDGLTVDTDTLYVDATNNRVGIGTDSPSYNLDIEANNPIARILEPRTGGAVGTSSLKLHGNRTGTGGAVTSLEFINTEGAASVAETSVNSIETFYQSAGNQNFRFNAGGSEVININSDGTLKVGTNTTNPAFDSITGIVFGTSGMISACRANTTTCSIGRTTDGYLMSFNSGGTSEGGITVSGTTVSYLGGHLSRWSQLADNTRNESIVKGTVMSNLDQMAVWTTDGVTEENEQLNCMKVSDVEGDPNVAGVFVNWDDDDDIYTNDMNIAMTGDMVIRIAQGVTVQRGDLLMSAGDGTAKPQGDDIVRSKTIAKVTSTTVSNTYDDGSYLVPCVLMAC